MMSVISAAADIVAKALGTTDKKKIDKFMKDMVSARKELEEQSYAINHNLDNQLAKARDTAHNLQLKLQSLQTAVRSVVLRLKVLDLVALEKDLGEDGTVPLRLALSELKELVRAYDGMPKQNMPDYGWSATAQYQQQIGGSTTVPYSGLTWTGNMSSSSSGGTIP